jgi:anti-sigma factor RsiW
MECWSVRQRVSAYLDDAVSAEEARLLERHLNTCRECTLETERYFGLRAKLHSLPRPMAPPELTTRLRVVASMVRMEAAAGASRWNRWRNRLELSLRHLMRPLAVPAVGGLCSALFLFGTLVPTFKSAFAMSALSGDVPTMLATEPVL